MSKYMVQKDKYSGNIVYMEYDLEGYSFKPKTTHDKPYISVNSVTIYEPKMIDNLLSKKFSKKFERLSQIIINFLFQLKNFNKKKKKNFYFKMIQMMMKVIL